MIFKSHPFLAIKNSVSKIKPFITAKNILFTTAAVGLCIPAMIGAKHTSDEVALKDARQDRLVAAGVSEGIKVRPSGKKGEIAVSRYTMEDGLSVVYVDLGTGKITYATQRRKKVEKSPIPPVQLAVVVKDVKKYGL